MGSFGSAEADRLERLGADSFRQGRLVRPGTWAVAFLAEWCPFCRDFAPRFASLAGDVRIAVGDLTDEENPLWEEFGIEVIPTVILFRDGAPVLRRDGTLGEGLGPRDLAAVRAALAGA
jgi:thioredoxin 1